VITHKSDKKSSAHCGVNVSSPKTPRRAEPKRNISLADLLAKLPVAELEPSLREFLSPLMSLLPEKRLCEVVGLVTKGILAAETPVVAAMRCCVSREEVECWQPVNACIVF